MSPWGHDGASAPGRQDGEAPSARQPGTSLALIFGGLALATAAVCALLLLMQRNEQRKLLAAVEGRDEQIGKLESARTEGQALVREYAAREAQARKDLGDATLDSEAKAREWATEREGLERQMQALRDEVTQAVARERQSADRAQASLELSEVPSLAVRSANGPWIDAKTDFKSLPTVKVYRPLRGIVDAELSRAVQEGMQARQVPVQATDFDAYIEARAVVRTLQLTPREVCAIAIVVQLVMPLVDLDLDAVTWIPVITELDEVVGADPATIETLFHDRVRLLTERVIERGLKGGPPGEPASQLLPSPGGSSSPGAAANPPPAGGGRAPKPGGP